MVAYIVSIYHTRYARCRQRRKRCGFLERMNQLLSSKRLFCILSGLSGVAGVALLALSFATAVGQPPGATYTELVKFGQEHYRGILLGGVATGSRSSVDRALCICSRSLGWSRTPPCRLDDTLRRYRADDGQSYR